MTLDDFLLAVAPLARYHARRLARRYAGRGLLVEADDLYQEGMIAALRLFPEYAPARAGPKAFVRLRVQGAMIDYVRLRGDEFGSGHYRALGRGAGVPSVVRRRAGVPSAEPAAPAADVADPPDAEFRAAVRRLGACLTPSELQFLADYYVRGRRMRDMAAARRVSESCVSLTHTRLIGSLRAAAAELGRTRSDAFAG